MPPSYQDFLAEILIDEVTLQQRIRELGAQITADYMHTPNVVLVCVLKGAMLFLSDLIRHISIPHQIEFMAISSYGVGGRYSSGTVRIELDMRTSAEGRHLILVEDIIDSGTTLNYIHSMLSVRNPASIKICTLLNKPSRRTVDIRVDYIGFDIPDKFVFGYGLDLDELYRNLPFIGVVQPDKYFHE